MSIHHLNMARTVTETVTEKGQSQSQVQGELHGTSDFTQIEAPVTWRAYIICGFASFGGEDNLLPRVWIFNKLTGRDIQQVFCLGMTRVISPVC